MSVPAGWACGRKKGKHIMARTSRIKRTGIGGARYHLISRTNNRAFLFGDAKVKDMLIDSLRRAAVFSGIHLHAYTGMDNHFHIVCKVTRSGEKVSEAEILRRVEVLKGPEAAQDLADQLASARALAASSASPVGDPAESILDRYRARMNDISQFVKTFKEHFDIRFKREHPYYGSIWAGRFTSTIIDSDRYLANVIRYVFFNPVRAGIVTRVRDYRWSFVESSCFLQHSEGSVPPGTGTGPNGEGADPVEAVRRPQLSDGKVYGSIEFVVEVIRACRSGFHAKQVGAHAVRGVGGYATHGYRIGDSGNGAY